MKACIYGGVLGVLAMAALSPAAITVSNPSFEADALAPGTDDYAGSNSPPFQNVTGWTVDRNDTAVTYTTSAQFSGAHDGSNFIFMNGAILHQDLGTMVAGQTYAFDISYGWRSDLPENLDAKKFAFILRPTISSATSLLISASPAFNEGEPPSPTVTTAPLPTAAGVLQHDLFSYTAGADDDGQPLTLQLQATDLQLLVDQVKLTTTTAPVPEPASLAAVGLAAAGLLGRRRGG